VKLKRLQKVTAPAVYKGEYLMSKRLGRIPIYLEIAQSLKEQILNGDYAPGDLLPSERILCEMMSVERATVRRSLDVLVQQGFITKIAGLGTRVLQQHQSELNSNCSANNIAFILPSDTIDKITQPFIANIFSFLEQECKRKNYNLIYATIHDNEDISDILTDLNVSGIIFLSYIQDIAIRQIKSSGIPSVLISNILPDVTSIVVDNIGGSKKAVEHLAGLGHRKIAFITGLDHYLNSIERLEGYKAAMSSLGIPIDENLIEHGDWSFESGSKAMENLLKSSCRPTAVFAANDMMALGAIRAIQQYGLCVPSDISVIGFDNLDQSA